MEHTTDERITLNPAYSLREFRILTGKTTLNNTISEIELKTKLCRKGDGFFCLNMPLISAAMQAVSGKEMAISLAQCGGISVIPCSIPVDEQVKIIKDVKRHKAGFQEEVVCFSPESKISDVIDTIHNTGYSIYPVTDNGMCNGKLIGIITDKDFHPVNHKDNTVSDHMITDLDVAEEGITLDEANEKMIKFRRGFLPLVDKDFNLKAVVFRKDIDKKLNFPNELVDEKNRYCIAAAVSTQP
ncbi:MAG: IMP dehydrogenase, partial [Candidatus Aenigmarchaeota archaeon]|nr:IMP dehydrogenase [Candidatus Aenigmarchaeota archaeon]